METKIKETASNKYPLGGTRRDFVKKSGLAAASLFAVPFLANAKQPHPELWKPFPKINNDDDLWKWVQNSYTVSSTVSNFNNRSVSPQPKVVQEVFEFYNRLFNETPSRYMWSSQDKVESVREKLAEIGGCEADEMAINRNTTEAINTVIWGLDLNQGDEIVLSEQDYSTVMKTWEQREKRHGIVLKYISFDLPVEDETLIVNTYVGAVTANTKVVTITHVNNLNGNVMPVKAIADAVKKKNPKVQVLVDGAHAFAHLDFKISDLNCEFYGASLHKWLCAPFGTGILYIKKSVIKDIWPLFPYMDPHSGDIRKFETLGTRMLPAELSIARAIDFQETIEIKRKEKRLRYLKDYWIQRVAEIPNVVIKTSLKPEFSCALGSFSLKNMDHGELGRRLLKDYHIHTTNKADKHKKFEGMRITPHVYTRISELDRLVKGIKQLAKV